MRKLVETGIIMISTLGWWGFVYPELCLPSKAETQNEEYILYEIEMPSGLLGKEFSDTKTETIQIKSLIGGYICQVKDIGKEKEDG